MKADPARDPSTVRLAPSHRDGTSPVVLTATETGPSTVAAWPALRTKARTTAIAKPIATGVNELRPPDPIVAHQAAMTMSPVARPTPIVSPAPAAVGRRPTRLAAQMPNNRQTA